MNFTFAALDAAAEAYAKLKSIVGDWPARLASESVAGRQGKRTQLSEEKLQKVQGFSQKFQAAIEADLNLPQALSTVWEMAKSSIPEQDKWELITDWDRVLALGLAGVKKPQLPAEIKQLMVKREELRRQQHWAEADQLRQQIIQKGYKIEDKHA